MTKEIEKLLVQGETIFLETSKAYKEAIIAGLFGEGEKAKNKIIKDLKKTIIRLKQDKNNFINDIKKFGYKK